ncbi:MAG: hypothetical protein RR326_09075 [Stenotrophomonas sp.]
MISETNNPRSAAALPVESGESPALQTAPSLAEFVAQARAHGIEVPALPLIDGQKHEAPGKAGASGWYLLHSNGSFPENGPAKWGAYGLDRDTGGVWIASPESARIDEEIFRPAHFFLGSDGIYSADPNGSCPVRICGPVRVIERCQWKGVAVKHENNCAGLFLEVATVAGVYGYESEEAQGPARLPIPARWLLGDGVEVLTWLADVGVWLSGDRAKDSLVVSYLRRCAADLPEGG